MLSATDTMRRHPCFDKEAHERVGRVHLAVAGRCNIQCAFCERKFCANLTIQHPGWARELLSPRKALELVRRLVSSRPGEAFVVGVAGPGEPLANEETFDTLGRVHREYPTLMKCVSTNGLLLEERLPQLTDAGVTALTVTVNAPDADVGERIYAWVRHRRRVYRGRAASELLIDRQFGGIEAALTAGLALKVNAVLVPGVNGQHLVRLARRLQEAGVPLMNIMPLLPGGRMSDRRAPTCDELSRARSECERFVPQFRQCEQCRADVIRFPGRARTEPGTGDARCL